MGKLPEYNRTNNEQSGVSTKISEFWNGRHVKTKKEETNKQKREKKGHGVGFFFFSLARHRKET